MTTPATTAQDGPLRTFLAIPPDAAARAYLMHHHQRLRAATGSDHVRWVQPEQWHLTVRFLGDLRPAQIEALIAALNQQGVPNTLSLTLTPPQVFPNRRQARAIACRVPTTAELQDLVRRTDHCLQAIGFPPETRPWRGHITLGRLRNPTTVPSHLASPRQPIPWQAQALVLYHSTLTPQGPQYRVMAAWSFRG
ncbi:MAG: RNA 2',3'-cyclic phosphodiesterase [Gloeomargarita sp. GXS_bins_116]